MSYEFDFAVFIGRFQPFHAGHLAVVREGLARSETLVVLLGSAWQPQNARNPWSHEERTQMIRRCLTDEENQRVVCLPLMDVPYNDEIWVRNVQTSVNGIVTAHNKTPHKTPRVALIGHEKDHTGFYLRLFPQWQSIAVDNFRQLSATPLREAYFSSEASMALQQWQAEGNLPAEIVNYLAEFSSSDRYQAICDELAFLQKYRQAWAGAPYPPTFVTVDAVVVQSGHVLLVERKAHPGKGLMALPGGFVDPHERLAAASLRELREETRLKVPAPVLQGALKRQKVYDEPNRSARGRTITHAFYYELQPAENLPKVKGGDDARHAQWVPLADLNPQHLFEDHYFIIQDLLGLN